MTATNHILCGAVIATLIQNPVLGVPVAFASHFVLDALPHFGYKDVDDTKIILRHKLGRAVIITDVLVVCLLAVLLYQAKPYALLLGVVAWSPDLIWSYIYVFYERHDKNHIRRGLTNFHQQIQRYERPWGLIVELFLAALFSVWLVGRI